MAELPVGLEQAFRTAAAELGMCSASWLFAREVSREGGPELLSRLRDELGRAFPALDAVVASALVGVQGPAPRVEALAQACEGARRVLVVGLEATWLDALVEALPKARLALLRHSAFSVDWERVLANHQGRVEGVDLETFQTWAGPSSALLTFAYGVSPHSTHVLPSWERVMGEDVRTQFRSLVAWDVLGSAFFVYPRWLVEVPLDNFSALVPA